MLAQGPEGRERFGRSKQRLDAAHYRLTRDAISEELEQALGQAPGGDGGCPFPGGDGGACWRRPRNSQSQSNRLPETGPEQISLARVVRRVLASGDNGYSMLVSV